MIVIETKIVVVIIEKEDFMADVEVLRLLPLEYNSSGRGFVPALFQNMYRFHMMFERNFLKKPSVD